LRFAPFIEEGAAGAAVQNFNVLFDLPETMGLL
jgi:N-acetyl-gamma-glutamylphosphate reductase